MVGQSFKFHVLSWWTHGVGTIEKKKETGKEIEVEMEYE